MNRNTRKGKIITYSVINQLLSQSCSCDDALRFFFGFNDLEVNLYFSLVQDNEKTVSQLCTIFDRNQSTIYTALEKLVSHGIVAKQKRSRETRGYEYVYTATSPILLKPQLKARLDQLYDQLSSCLDRFENDASSCEIKY